MEANSIHSIKLTDQECYLQKIFEGEDLLASLDQNDIPVRRSLYNHVVYSSEIVETLPLKPWGRNRFLPPPCV